MRRGASFVMPGRRPGIHDLIVRRRGWKEVVDARKAGMTSPGPRAHHAKMSGQRSRQSGFPCWISRTFLAPASADLLFSPDRGDDLIMGLEPDECLQAIALREALDQPGAVLRHAAHEIGGDADIEHPVRLVRHEVDEGEAHRRMLRRLAIRRKRLPVMPAPSRGYPRLGRGALRPEESRDARRRA